MPRTGATFNLLNNTNYPAVEDEVIDQDGHNAMLEDLAQGITDSVARDGSGSMAGDLNMGTHKLTNLAAGSANGHSVRYEQVQLASAFATAWEGAAWAAGKMGYATGASSVALIDTTAIGRAFLNYADPNADRIIFFDDSEGALANLTVGAGLAITTTTIAVSANLQTYSAITPSANVQSFLGAADYAAMRTQLSLTALATTTPGTGVATALGVNVGSAGAFVVNGGALGTPASGTLTNCTGLPNASVVGLGTAALATIGTSGDTVPKNNAGNTFSVAQVFASGTDDTQFRRTDDNSLQLSFRQNTTVRGYIGANSTYGFQAYNSALSKSLTWNASTGALNADSMTAGGVAIPTISSSDTLSNKTIASPTVTGSAQIASANFSATGVTVTINSTNNTIPLSLSYASTAFAYFGSLATNSLAVYNGSLKVHVKIDDAAVSIENNGTAFPDFRITAAPSTLATNSAGFRGVGATAAKGGAHTFVLADAGQLITYNDSGSAAFTIPPNSSVAFPIGTVIPVQNIHASGTCTIAEGVGVTLSRGDGTSGTGTRTLVNNGPIASLVKESTNGWRICGPFT